MTNQDYNPISPQSQTKLAVYSRYLRLYLEILLRSSVPQIHVYDMLAGKGMYGKMPGSAKIAHDIISDFRKKFPHKEVRLYLNEYNMGNYRDLRKNIHNENISWVSFEQKDAHEAVIGHLNDSPKAYKLFYLDPFGYTQIKRVTIDNIMSQKHTECILFVPVSRIVQFMRKRSETEKQLKPIAEFLQEYGIDISRHTKAVWRDWGDIIKNAFAKIYSDKFVGYASLETDNANYYALYFIGSHYYGLHKFLESVNKIKKELQLELISAEDKEIENYLSCKERTNNELYLWGLRHGWLPKKTIQTLADMERKGKISVELCAKSQKRTKGAFYLDMKEPAKIVVKFLPKLW